MAYTFKDIKVGGRFTFVGPGAPYIGGVANPEEVPYVKTGNNTYQRVDPKTGQWDGDPMIGKCAVKTEVKSWTSTRERYDNLLKRIMYNLDQMVSTYLASRTEYMKPDKFDYIISGTGTLDRLMKERCLWEWAMMCLTLQVTQDMDDTAKKRHIISNIEAMSHELTEGLMRNRWVPRSSSISSNAREVATADAAAYWIDNFKYKLDAFKELDKEVNG